MFYNWAVFSISLKEKSVSQNFMISPPKWELTFSVGMDGHFEDNSHLSQLRKHACKLPTLYLLSSFFICGEGQGQCPCLNLCTIVIISQKCDS